MPWWRISASHALTTIGEDRLTETGLSLGTPIYMSPEQAAGDEQLDERSDLYLLGCVLYEMLGGAPPFAGPSSRAIMARHAIDPVPSLRTVRSNVPPGLEAAILRVLSKVPGDRFATAAEFDAAVQRGASGAPLSFAPAQVTRPVAKTTKAPVRFPQAFDAPAVPLIGRTAEWKRLTNTWQDVQRGPAQCVLVSGVAGIGKTRSSKTSSAGRIIRVQPSRRRAAMELWESCPTPARRLAALPGPAACPASFAQNLARGRF